MMAMRKLSATTCIGSLFISMLAVSAAFGEEFEIKLVRPAHKNATAQVAIEVSLSEAKKETIGGIEQPDKSSEVFLKFTGQSRVIKADDKTIPTCVEYTVEDFSVTADGRASSLLPKGTVITATATDKDVVYTSPTVKITPQLRSALVEVFPLDPSDGRLTADQLFGTQTPKTTGEEWKPEHGPIIEAMKKAGYPIPTENLDIGMRLEGPTTINGVHCLDVRGSMKITLGAPMIMKIMGISDSKIAAAAKVNKGEVVFNGAAIYPQEEDKPLLSSDVNLQIDLNVEIPNEAGTYRVVDQIKKSRSMKVNPIE